MVVPGKCKIGSFSVCIWRDKNPSLESVNNSMIRSSVQHVCSKVVAQRTTNRQQQRFREVHHILYCPSTTSGWLTQNKQYQSTTSASLPLFRVVGNEYLSKRRRIPRIPPRNERTALMNHGLPTVSNSNAHPVYKFPRRYISDSNHKNKNGRKSTESSPSRSSIADFGDGNDQDLTILSPLKTTTTTTSGIAAGAHPAHFHSGPSLELGLGRLGLHTYASVVAKAVVRQSYVRWHGNHSIKIAIAVTIRIRRNHS